MSVSEWIHLPLGHLPPLQHSKEFLPLLRQVAGMTPARRPACTSPHNAEILLILQSPETCKVLPFAPPQVLGSSYCTPSGRRRCAARSRQDRARARQHSGYTMLRLGTNLVNREALETRDVRSEFHGRRSVFHADMRSSLSCRLKQLLSQQEGSCRKANTRDLQNHDNGEHSHFPH